MNIAYRYGNIDDLKGLKDLAIKSWGKFQRELTSENWERLSGSLNDDKTYAELIEKAKCIICTCDSRKIIGMAFLVPSGNPTDIYDKDWSCIRLVSVDPDFEGQGIGRQLITKCVDLAKANGEKVIALHTSELMDKARHIYESLGFKVLREIDQRLGKRYWLYRLDLNELIDNRY